MKKFFLGGLALTLVAGALIGFNRMCSMTRLGVDHVQSTIDEAIPVDVQLRQLEMALKDLDPEIKSAQLSVVRQEVSVNELQDEITQITAGMDQQWSEIVALRQAIPEESDTEFVSVNGKEYSRDKVTNDLRRKLTRFKGVESSVNAKQDLLGKREETLTAKQKHLQNLLDLKSELTGEIEQLKARLTLVQAKQVEVSEDVDNAKVDEIKELTKKVQRRIAEKEKMLEHEANAYGEIQVTPEADEQDVLEEIDARRADEAVRGKDGELINIR